MATNPLTTLKLNAGRQYRLTAMQQVTFENITNATDAGQVPVIKLPPGAQILDGEVVIDTPWDATACSATLGTATAVNAYSGTVDLKSAAGARAAMTGVNNGAILPEATTLFLNVAITGAATKGSARVRVDYIVRDRANEVQT